MSTSKSDLIKELSKSYPNLLKKDLSRLFEIFMDEIKLALKNSERVEIRGWGTFSPKIQKKRKSRNPKTGQELFIPEKKSIHFKMSKELLDEMNND